MQSDAEYLRQRAREEREAALSSRKASVRLRHLEFAEAYELRLREIEAQQRAEIIHFVTTGSFGGLVASMSEVTSASVREA